MKPQHDPGPWFAVQDSRGWYVSLSAEGYYGTALTGWGCVMQSEGNARAMAAVPNLLFACATAQAAIDTQTPEIRETRLKVARAALAAALAKARGEA